jgi:uncharacterized protein YdaT
MSPWSPEEFRDRHNGHLTMAQARKAAAQANAILKKTGSDKLAIATANKNAKRKKK